MTGIDAQTIRRFRLCAHHLDRRYEKKRLPEIVGACGMQNTPPGAWETALYNRIPDSCLAEMNTLLYAEKSLLQAWSFRGAPVVFPVEESDAFLSALIPRDDEDWIYTTASLRRAEYRKVSPGMYRFIVTGSNNDGVWNPVGVSLTIIVSPPWWKSWMFRIAFILMAVLLIWGLIYLRINNIRKKHEVEKKMLSIEKQIFELEQKALRLQMNPHFIFNSLNAIQNFVLSNDTDKAVNYLAKFSHLMRMILANSTASHIPLKDEMKALMFYMDLEKLRFDDKFTYEIHVDPAIDEEFIEIPPMLFQPYVENAIIHGLVNSPKQGLIEIWLKVVEKGTLRCIIQDNGIGREKAIEIRAKSGIKRQPRGMIITEERLQILNKQSSKNSLVRITDLKDDRGEATGTRIELDIQYKEA